METKLIEIRDSATFIPALAIRVSGADGYLLRRAGFGVEPLVLLINLNDMRCAYSAYEWNTSARTLPTVHQHLQRNWETVASGDVVDVQYILGERATPKVSEQIDHPQFI